MYCFQPFFITHFSGVTFPREPNSSEIWPILHNYLLIIRGIVQRSLIKRKVSESDKIRTFSRLSGMYSFFLDICQLRLDFDNFDITETTAGVCTDSLGFTTPSSQNPQDLCGTLTGLHRKYSNDPCHFTYFHLTFSA